MLLKMINSHILSQQKLKLFMFVPEKYSLKYLFSMNRPSTSGVRNRHYQRKCEYSYVIDYFAGAYMKLNCMQEAWRRGDLRSAPDIRELTVKTKLYPRLRTSPRRRILCHIIARKPSDMKSCSVERLVFVVLRRKQWRFKCLQRLKAISSTATSRRCLIRNSVSSPSLKFLRKRSSNPFSSAYTLFRTLMIRVLFFMEDLWRAISNSSFGAAFLWQQTRIRMHEHSNLRKERKWYWVCKLFLLLNFFLFYKNCHSSLRLFGNKLIIKTWKWFFFSNFFLKKLSSIA